MCLSYGFEPSCARRWRYLSAVSSVVLQEINEPEHGLWTFHQPLSVLGAEIGTRMTVIRLENGGLLVHSPIRLTADLVRVPVQVADGWGRWYGSPI